MEQLFFKCSVCDSIVDTKEKAYHPYSDWAYGCAVWSDLGDDVPDLVEPYWERHWEYSKRTPAVGENRTVWVELPFNEKLGNEFWLLYTGRYIQRPYDNMSKWAVARCRFERILVSTQYCAWITVYVQRVIPLSKLCEVYHETKLYTRLEKLDSPIANQSRFYRYGRWYIKAFSGDGDLGETYWIYTDDNGKQHLVMKSWWDFHDDVLHFGNVTGIQPLQLPRRGKCRRLLRPHRK